MFKSFIAGLKDAWNGLKHHEVWMMMAWFEIRQRYRRSVIGPFWLTISMAITVLVMGPLYGKLFGQATVGYVAYLAIGMVFWTFISGIINDSSSGFSDAAGYIQEFNLPLSVYIYSVVWKQFIVLCHSFVVIVFVIVLMGGVPLSTLLIFPLALCILLFSSLWLGLLFGVICTRFRDVKQTIANIIQILFFATPIMWKATMLKDKAWLVNLNPIYCYIELLRAPLLGESVSVEIFLGVCISALFLIFLSATLFGRYRTRIAYWL